MEDGECPRWWTFAGTLGLGGVFFFILGTRPRPQNWAEMLLRFFLLSAIFLCMSLTVGVINPKLFVHNDDRIFLEHLHTGTFRGARGGGIRELWPLCKCVATVL